ncbi:MAG: hypothetical protein R3C49_24680 [Planctomycetaceae bacterium]
MEAKSLELQETNDDLSSTNEKLNTTINELQSAERSIREQQKELVQQGGELATAVWMGFAVIESEYENEDPVTKILASEGQKLGPNDPRIEARSPLIRAFEPLVQLMRSPDTMSSVAENRSAFEKFQALSGMTEGVKLLKLASEDLNRSLELDPELGLSYLARAQLWGEAEASMREYAGLATAIGLTIPDATDIQADWDRAVQLMPNCSFAYSGRAWYRGLTPEAEVDLLKAIKLEPGNDIAQARLGQIRDNEQRYEKAISHFQKALTEKSPGHLLFSSGWSSDDIRIRICNSAMRWANRTEEEPARIRALAYLRLFSDGIPELQTARFKLWQKVLEKLVESPELARELLRATRIEESGITDAAYEDTRRVLEYVTEAFSTGTINVTLQNRLEKGEVSVDLTTTQITVIQKAIAREIGRHTT